MAALHDALMERGEPVSLADLVAAVQATAPLPVKDPRGAVRRALAGGLRAIRLDDGRWVLPEIALAGAVFRCTPQRAELEHGRLYAAGRFSPFLPAYPASSSAARLIDAANGSVTAAEIEDLRSCALDFAGWYRAHGFSAGDSILISVSYRDGLAFRLTHESLSHRDPAVSGRTRTFADAAMELLAGWGREEAPLAALVQAVLVRHPDLLQAPPDDYREVFAKDGRFRLLEGNTVSAADYRRPIDYLHLFPKWGRSSLQAMSPGYATPLEDDEAGQGEPAGHWLRLISVEVVALDPDARRATLRAHADSSAGAFQSDVELALRARSPLARSLLVTLRGRFRLLVAGQAPAGHGRGSAQAVVIENEAPVLKQMTEFLRSLDSAAGNLAEAAILKSMGRTRLEFTGPQAS